MKKRGILLLAFLVISLVVCSSVVFGYENLGYCKDYLIGNDLGNEVVLKVFWPEQIWNGSRKQEEIVLTSKCSIYSSGGSYGDCPGTSEDYDFCCKTDDGIENWNDLRMWINMNTSANDKACDFYEDGDKEGKCKDGWCQPILFETNCNDGIDNNRDGLIDMQDSQCHNLTTNGGICLDNSIWTPDQFKTQPNKTASSHDGADGCCGDDNGTTPAVLINGGFEGDIVSRTVKGWTRSIKGDIREIITTDKCYSGQCVHVEGYSKYWQPGYYQNIPVPKQNTKYLITAMLKGKAQIKFSLMDNEDKYQDRGYIQGSGAPDKWEFVSTEIDVTKDTAYILITAQNYGEGGEGWIDDVNITPVLGGIRGDYGYIDLSNKSFCNKDFKKGTELNPKIDFNLETALWKWWDAEFDIFKIHTVVGLYDVISNGEKWYYCNADDSIDEFSSNGFPINNLETVPNSKEPIQALCPCWQGKYANSVPCGTIVNGEPVIILCWKDFATWCDDLSYPPQTLADCGVWVNEQGIDTNPVTDDQITTVGTSTTIDTSEAFNNKLGDFGENFIIYDPSITCVVGNEGELCYYDQDERCINGSAVNTIDTKDDKDTFCCVGPKASCEPEDEHSCDYFKYVLCDIGEKCMGAELNTFDSSDEQPCCESYQYCKSDIGDLSGDIMGVSAYKRGNASICYNEAGRNYIGECCSGSFCANKNRQSLKENIYIYDVNTFGMGGMLHSIMSYDSVENEFFKTKVRRYSSKSTSETYIKTHINIIPLKSASLDKYSKSNWSEFDYLNFKLAFNQYDPDAKIIIHGMKAGEEPLFEGTLEQYTNNLQPGIWHAYKIPLDIPSDDSNKLRNNKINNVYIEYNYHKVFYIFMDNFYLSKADEPTWYCAGPFGKWLKDVEPEPPIEPDDYNFLEWAPYKYVCDYQLAYGWTGTKCCGDDYLETDDKGEYYDDESRGGCFKGITIFNNERLIDYGIQEEEILYGDTKFRDCNTPSRSFGTGDNRITTVNTPSCTVYGDYFCPVDAPFEWNELSSLGDIGEITSLQVKPGPFGGPYGGSGCCPPELCWNYVECVDSGIWPEGIGYFCNLTEDSTEWKFCKPDRLCQLVYDKNGPYFCDSAGVGFDWSWKNAHKNGIEAGIDDVDIATRDHEKSVPEDYILPVVNKFFLPEEKENSCCPNDMCWNGLECVEAGILLDDDKHLCYEEEEVSNWKTCNESNHCEILEVSWEDTYLYYYCGTDNIWHGTDDSTLQIKQNPPDVKTPPTEGCCPVGKCWNSQEECVPSSLGIEDDSNKGFDEGLVNVPGSFNVPTSYSQFYSYGFGLGEEIDQYVCQNIENNGTWAGVYKKTSPDIENDFGYCLYSDQCWSEVYGQCVNSGNFSLEDDFFCDEGWSSRTKLVALTLLEKVKDANSLEDYTLFCDDYTKSLNNIYGLMLSEWDNIDDEANFCVLEYLEGTKKKVAFGIALNDSIENTELKTILDIDVDKCSKTDTSQSIYGEYENCDTNKLWYNSKIKTIIYSLEGISGITQPKAFDFFINPFKTIINFIIDLINPFRGGEIPDYQFAKNVKNFNRIYISTKADKTVRAVVEDIYDEEFMLVNYVDFGADQVQIENMTQLYKETTENQIEYNVVDGNIYITSKDPITINDVWTDLTAKLRLIDVGVYRGMPSRFVFRGAAYFDVRGNLVLTGHLVENTLIPQARAGQDEFIIQDQHGDNVAIINLAEGNMYIQGRLHEHSQILTPGINDFIIKDNKDKVVAYIDEFGNLFLRRRLRENVKYMRW